VPACPITCYAQVVVTSQVATVVGMILGALVGGFGSDLHQNDPAYFTACIRHRRGPGAHLHLVRLPPLSGVASQADNRVDPLP
jgi:hypothetical protein